MIASPIHVWAREKRIPIAIFAAAAAVYFAGWSMLWFLTDDAYIAFRYVSNAQLGFGYVWNAPPFLPVEGYTSFLWVALLDFVWSCFGVEPPQSSNWLAFAFGLGTLAVTARLMMCLQLCAALERYRSALLFLVLAGMVTNFNFLVWTSSGLETSLFNFLLVAWAAAALTLAPGSVRWVAGLAATAGLLSLTRPDGLLVVAASGALVAIVTAGSTASRSARHALAALPLLLPVAHILWRLHAYGEWLPNTYYAKHVAPWSEAGLRYLASYGLEYCLWFWALLALAAIGAGPDTRPSPARWIRDPAFLSRACVVSTLLVQVGYYTLRVGGDHFEYRVYSQTVCFVLLSAVWSTNRICAATRIPAPIALALPALVVALSWPIPWTLWGLAQEADTRRASFDLVVPIAGAFPASLEWYTGRFDALQDWLIRGHAIGKRHQEHKVFHLFGGARFPRERRLDQEWYARHRVYASKSVGIVGWVMARGHVIDTVGLNDWVIARNPVHSARERRMAHDRKPPPGYVKCFKPNVKKPSVDVKDTPVPELLTTESTGFVLSQRKSPLTSADIEACERIWRAALTSNRSA